MVPIGLPPGVPVNGRLATAVQVTFSVPVPPLPVTVIEPALIWHLSSALVQLPATIAGGAVSVTGVEVVQPLASLATMV